MGEATLASVTLIEPPVAKAPPTPNPEPAVEVPATGYDHLFGETVMRDVESAAVRSEEEAEEQADVGDRTVMVEDIAELRRRRRAERAGTPVVAAEPQHVLLLSTGGREVLDQPVIIGRAPSAERVSAGRVPRLVSMTTPNQDISRTHAEIALEGGTVVVTDLHSRNGTTITMPGRPPQKLRAGEPTAVIVGTVVDLGDGATITVQAGAS